MKTGNSIDEKIVTPEELQRRLARWRVLGKKIAFTNGCFDLLHAGHIASLRQAAQTADVLIVGLNADVSVKKLKGDSRPLNSEHARALVLAALSMVDAVVLFSEDTPRELIKSILPDFLVKGGDYKVEDIAGAEEVIAAGGQVIINPILEGFSTTSLVDRMKNGV
ncbi:D-glycero-beta-D-manno-heptose 1-phosphate adenylyltransferase [Paraflavisolibacter sp. H34]|uniref:D-glycero-beta-D-manno-heptose 1-phosphate adenylyltransferase n=1 Tax=Huijunlia imazamoxiresistens TaxID=3127457 RepID=UPI00301808A7